MAVRKLTAKDLRDLNAKRSAEYHALPQSADRSERRQYILRCLNEEPYQERVFTGEGEAENRGLDIDLEKRIIRGVSIASDEPYLRWFGWEILDHSAGAINLKRLNNGAAFLKEHWGDQVAVCSRGYIDGNKTRVDLLFSQRADAMDELRDIADGVRRNTSCRYTIDDIKWLGLADDGEDNYLVTKSTMIHGASVSDPADFTVGFGRSLLSEPPAVAGGHATPNNQIDPAETRACVEGDPACADESCLIHYEDDTTADGAKSKERRGVRTGSGSDRVNKKRARKSMKRKLKSTPAAKKEACKEGDAVCDDRDCEVHYEEVEEREIEPSREDSFKAIAKSAALGPVEEKRFLRIASDRALGDEGDEKELRAALLADRKKHASDHVPDPEDPDNIAARNGGLAKISSRVRLKFLKTHEEAHALGRFLGGVMGLPNAKNWCREHGISLARAQSESDNESGGIWVPTEWSESLVILREKNCIVRQFADVETMTSRTKNCRRQRGGLTAYPSGAKGASRKVKESELRWDFFELIARKWKVTTKIEDEVGDGGDAVISLADRFAGESAYAFGKAEENAFFNADGTSAFHGTIGLKTALRKVAPSIANIKGLVVASGNLFSEFTQADHLKLVGTLPDYADTENTAWYMSRYYFWNVVVPLMLAAGGTTVQQIEDAPIKKYLSYPVHISQKLPRTDANSQIACYLGDVMLSSTFGDRLGQQVRQTDTNDDDWDNDIISMKCIERFDFNHHDVGDTAEAGPVVGLISAAS